MLLGGVIVVGRVLKDVQEEESVAMKRSAEIKECLSQVATTLTRALQCEQNYCSMCFQTVARFTELEQYLAPNFVHFTFGSKMTQLECDIFFTALYG